jgi:hypothetical protein
MVDIIAHGAVAAAGLMEDVAGQQAIDGRWSADRLRP